ncbi:PepSY domain-containing protein [Candidatus Thiothrix sp. Deng01]|uniref:PepSY domain-containing protein n=1 Tax=Candidatus Thiothrix phosphatis TaxID=3112415 RepID=A0ABU6CXV6_9GAMM|nr:PepSY domain-containing protein [Candidatus Thiothrix sp. Deng01]MEB4591614.1 PepSY domain-containing protein [Candidatus Thiothrix sp. Deng01]
MKTTIAATLSGMLLASTMGYAAAAPTTPAPAPAKQDIFATLSTTKISLDDAIKTAEQTVSGKLVKAELDSDSSPNTYRVAIADSGNRTVTFMKIDSSTGKMLGSKVYRPDNRAASAAGKTGAATPMKAAPAASTAKPAASATKSVAPAASAPAASSPLKTSAAPAAAKPVAPAAAAPAATNPLKSTTATTPAAAKP